MSAMFRIDKRQAYPDCLLTFAQTIAHATTFDRTIACSIAQRILEPAITGILKDDRILLADFPIDRQVDRMSD